MNEYGDPPKDFIHFLEGKHEDFLELTKRSGFIKKIVHVKVTLDSVRHLLEPSTELLLYIKKYLDAIGSSIYSAIAKAYISEIEKLGVKLENIIRKLDKNWLNKVNDDKLEVDKNNEIG